MNQPINEIKLEFSYTEAEYLAAARLLTFRDSDALARLILSSILIIGGTSILIGLLTDFPWWAACTGAALLLAAIYYNALVWQMRHYFRGEPKFRDQYQLVFSDDGIAFKTAHLDAKISWNLYTKVLEGTDMYVMVYGKDLRMMTLVPKRVFRDSREENAFRELLARHISTHTSSRKLKAREVPAPEYKPTSLNPPDWR